GPAGHLLFPSLSYQQVHRQQPRFHWRDTPSNVGALPEWFRQQPESIRSIHPTHSVSGQGPDIAALLGGHEQDDTPCGPNSPFHRLRSWGGQILMLGCGLGPNTSMHAIEELVEPPYLFDPLPYSIEMHSPGGSCIQSYRPHGFQGWVQRYDRIESLLQKQAGLRFGYVGPAQSWLIEVPALWEVALRALHQDPWYFVDPAGQSG
ncbi:MAG: AAC(3) family N-acetyltransferase, partial [Bacteroidota bacterium]